MSKEKLDKVLEYLVNKETDKASELLKSYIIETAADIHQKLVESEEDVLEMERDVEHDDMGDDLADEIAADKDEIKSEEMFGEDEEPEADAEGELDMDLNADGDEGEEGSEEHMDLEDLESEIEELEADVDDVEHHVDDVEAEHNDMAAKFDKLAAEFEKIKNAEEVEHDEDFDDNGEIGAPEGEEHAEEHGEEHMDAGEEHAEEMPTEESITEKWKGKHNLNPAKKGMWDGWTEAELRSELSKLKKRQEAHKEKHGKADAKISTRIREVEFALRAKNKFGKVKEGAELDESIELHSTGKVDMKDKAPGAGEKSPVPTPKDRIARLGGEPVKVTGPTHKGYDRETKKVGEVTKHSNVVDKGSDALTKTEKLNMKDKTPGAGESPAMPKGK